MARFDVYRSDGGLVLDLQTDILHGLTTRVVAPLLQVEQAPLSAGRLNPVLEVRGQLYVLHPQLMAAVPASSLGAPVENLLRHYDRIVAAVDMIFLGF